MKITLSSGMWNRVFQIFWGYGNRRFLGTTFAPDRRETLRTAKKLRFLLSPGLQRWPGRGQLHWGSNFHDAMSCCHVHVQALCHLIPRRCEMFESCLTFNNVSSDTGVAIIRGETIVSDTKGAVCQTFYSFVTSDQL